MKFTQLKASEKDIKNWWFSYKKENSEDAKNKLIEFYLPLVKYAVARILPSLPHHIVEDDLISAGILGLIDAIEHYNIDTNTKFESFAGFRIHGAIIDELRAMDWVPRSIRAKARKLQTAYTIVERKLGRAATDVEISEFLNISLEEFNKLINETKCVNLISLNSPVKKGEKTQFSELIADNKNKIPIDEIQKKDRKKIIIEAINRLPEQEKKVLMLYYYDELTFKEIGKVLGVTESRVSQIHSKAIFRLKGRLDLNEVVADAPY